MNLNFLDKLFFLEKLINRLVKRKQKIKMKMKNNKYVKIQFDLRINKN